jgi:nucleotide-binding universal stress UspA family protein
MDQNQMGEEFMPASETPRFAKLLVCTDNSPSSPGVIKTGLEVGRLTSAKLRLLEVVMTPLYQYQLLTSLEQMQAREQEVLAQLEHYQASAAEAGVDLEVRVRTSATAYQGILEEAEADQPGLIVMGRKGSTRLSRLLMGSTAERVIGLSACSVLIVPHNAVLNLKRILLAHDGSEYGEAAWREVIHLAKLAKSEVIAVSVARDDRREIDCRMVLQHMEASAERHGIPLQSVFLRGRPVEKIVETAEEERVGLVVMGSHGRTGLARFFMGSVAERVVGTARCPVLVVKMRQAEEPKEQ